MNPDCPCGLPYSVPHGCVTLGAPVTFKKSAESCFFVYGLTGGGNPKKAHGTKEAAVEEAKRLAAQHPGQEFIVLAPCAKVAAEVSPVLVTPIIA